MNRNDKYFSEEYAPEPSTDDKVKDRKPSGTVSDIVYTDSESKTLYIPGKPYRTIIRARISHG